MAYFLLILEKKSPNKNFHPRTIRVIWQSSMDGVPYITHRVDRTQRDPSTGATTSTAYRDPDAGQERQQK